MSIADHLPRDQLAARLLARLAERHTGKARGVTAAQLAHQLQISERTLRALVSELRGDHRAKPKSSAELEEEFMASLPQFNGCAQQPVPSSAVLGEESLAQVLWPAA